MYCIYCKKDVEGKFCAICGHKNISSEKEWKNWEHVYADYPKSRLEEMINNENEYQENAIAAARYLYDNYVDEPVEDDFTFEQEQSQDDKIWFYSFEGERKGPISTAELLSMYNSGFMRDTSAVWKSGYSDWIRLDQAGVIPEHIKRTTPPPVAPQNMDNRAIVFLLFVPIISTLIQFVIAGVFYIDASKLWWVAYGLNTVCCAIDYYHVKKAGYNANKLMIAFLFLIPLYIYKRMEMVNGRKWLATVIWIIVFVVDLLIPNVFWVKLIGASNPSMISSVQEGTFYSLPDVKLSSLFNRTLEDCEWETYMGANRRVLVSVDGLLEDRKFEIVFEMNMDNSFEISSMRWGGQNCTSSQMNDVLNYLFESYR